MRARPHARPRRRINRPRLDRVLCNECPRAKDPIPIANAPVVLRIKEDQPKVRSIRWQAARQPQQELDGGALARAVGAEEADDLAGLDAERHLVDDAAAAIENAQRFAHEKQRTERLGMIARVSQRIAARLDPLELFATTVEELHVRLGYDHVSLFLLDPLDDAVLVQRARASRWPRGESLGYRQSITQGIIGAAARQRAPQLINDVLADPRYVPVPKAAELRAEEVLVPPVEPHPHDDPMRIVLRIRDPDPRADVRRVRHDEIEM